MADATGSSPVAPTFMAKKEIIIEITEGERKLCFEALLNTSRTAAAVWDSLPLASVIQRWGEEIYFSVPIEEGPDDAKKVVEKGDMAYWPEGPALCIFFGPTPISRGEEIRPASPVNIVGKVKGNLSLFKKTTERQKISLRKKEGG